MQGSFLFTCLKGQGAWRRVALCGGVLLLWCFAVMAMIGGAYDYSVIPYADAWHGYLGFYNRLPEAGWASFWAQHNEHRIVVARILFWLDLYFLQGKTPALVILNYVFSLGMGLVFLLISSRIAIRFPRWVIFSFLLVPCFTLVQMQNLYLPFQGQFTLSYLLPLLAFYFLGISSMAAERQRWFWAACVMGCISVGTMANGLLALPVLVLLGAFLGIGRWRIAALCVLSVLAFLLYFHGYRAESNKTPVLDTFISSPLDSLHFLLLYLGSPFYYVFQEDSRAAVVAGGAVIALSVVFLIRALRCGEFPRFEWVLLAFLAFVGGGALACTGGRLGFGFEQALASRYCTPVIWAWAALVVLAFSPRLGFSAARPAVAAIVVLLAFSFYPYQVSVVRQGEPELKHFAMRSAALAMQLQVLDKDILRAVSPDSPERLLKNAKGAEALSAFTQRELTRARAYLGTDLHFNDEMPPCRAAVNAFELVPSDRSYRRIQGWVFDTVERAAPFDMIAVDDHGVVVGYAIVGKARPDVVGLLGPDALHSGFLGYMRADVEPDKIKLVGLEPNCAIEPGWADAFSKAFALQLGSVHKQSECPGGLDELLVHTGNGAPSVTIAGWIAGDTAAGVAPEGLFLRVASKGNTQLLPVPLWPRPDVNAYFQKPQMGATGFSMKVELPVLADDYELSFIRRYRNEWAVCQNITRTLSLNKAAGK